MIKLTDILNELEINNPRQITVEKAKQYFIDNIYNNGIEFNINGNGWKEYKQICKPYCEKYKIINWMGSVSTFKKLSQPDLDKFYNEMRQLVKKYVGKDVLNELEINKPLNLIIKLATELVNAFYNEIWWDDEGITYSENIEYVNPILVNYLQNLGKHEEFNDIYKDFQFNMIDKNNNNHIIAMYITEDNRYVEFEIMN